MTGITGFGVRPRQAPATGGYARRSLQVSLLEPWPTAGSGGVLGSFYNIAYCAAYAVDVIARLSAFRPQWLRMRWVLLLVGIAFAAILANFFSRVFVFSSTPSMT